MTKRRNFSDNFKATVALEALRGDKTVQDIAAKRQFPQRRARLTFGTCSTGIGIR